MSTQIPKSRYLPPKEASNFRSILKLYEQREYKKALKLADGILKKYPEHGETLAMKGLMLCFQKKKEEGHELIKKGLRCDLTSFICWHVYGLFYRTEHNYEEAVKCYTHALKYDPENTNILRDLGLLQFQMRNYEGAVNSRKTILQQRPNVRQNWTALAAGYYMLKNYTMAESILTKYEESLKQPLPKEDTENSELILYKNVIIYESGDVKRALEHLDSISDKVLDKVSVLEYRAKYLLELGRNTEAIKVFRLLLNRNPDYTKYYYGLERALAIEDDIEKKKELYKNLAEKYTRSDPAKRIPLDFLQGADFKVACKDYIINYLERGVPSAFVNVKPLYKDADKAKIIGEVVTEFFCTLTPTKGAIISSDESGPTTYLWTIYFLALHHSKIGDHDKALELIDMAIQHTPTLVEAHMVKAKVLKSKGDLLAASDSMNAARELDLQDRFLNTKAAKYLMRAGKSEEAIAVVSLFTVNDAKGKGVSDLHEMQAIWFLIEQAEMYLKLGKVGLALKRFQAVKKVFEDWWNVQFDFHQYATRRGTMRAYTDLLKWEDELFCEPAYLRAAEGAIKTYLSLYDTPKSVRVAAELDGLSEEERKKALKKAKRERAKENKHAESAKIGDDDDPFGRQLENTNTPLEDAEAFWKPIVNSTAYDQSLSWGQEIEKRKAVAAANNTSNDKS
ncbi:NMDA receptor-regulated protein 1-domain-containing protein [Dipodascopsis uninucleata]